MTHTFGINNLVIFLIVCINPFSLRAQTDSVAMVKDEYAGNKVIWVKEINSSYKVKPGQSFFSKVSGIITGRETEALTRPVAILAEMDDSLWILDQGSNRLFRFAEGRLYAPDMHTPGKEILSSLVSLSSIPGEGLIFTDSKSNGIYLYMPDKKKLRKLNDTLQFEQPTGIAWSAVNNYIWVTETRAHRVTVLDSDGRIIKSIGNRGNSPGQFNFPTHLWVDGQGYVYIVDAMNFRVQIFNKDGTLITVFGIQGDATGYIARPKGIATDSQGNIYLVDALFHAVQVFDRQGNFLYQFGEQGRGQSQLWLPSGIYIDKYDYIYIADSYNARVQVFKIVKQED